MTDRKTIKSLFSYFEKQSKVAMHKINIFKINLQLLFFFLVVMYSVDIFNRLEIPT